MLAILAAGFYLIDTEKYHKLDIRTGEVLYSIRVLQGRAPPVYRERVVWWWLSAILGTIALLMLLALVYQETVGPLGSKPAPSLVYLIMMVLFLFLNLNFSVLSITVKEGGISVGFGLPRRHYPFSSIDGVGRDTASALSYGGWGIRATRIDGRSRLAYTVPGLPRLVFSLQGSRFDEFALSTRNPEELKAVIEGHTVPSRTP